MIQAPRYTFPPTPARFAKSPPPAAVFGPGWGPYPTGFYFTALRQHRDLWRWAIIILAAVGCVLCLTGIWLGVKYFRPSGYGVVRAFRRSPYRSWRGLHHYLGLVFGLPALTFTFSGMMSLHPFDWAAPALPDRTLHQALSGGPPLPALCKLNPALAVQGMAEVGFSPKMLSIIAFDGKPYYRASDGKGNTRLTTAGESTPRIMKAIPVAELKSVAKSLLPGSKAVLQEVLPRGDLYLPKWDRPVLKVVYDNPGETWLYLDPVRARIIRRLDSNGRLNRWLYHFLHCLDLPWLVRNEIIRQAILLFLMAGGTILCFSGVWSWLRRKKQKRRRG